MYHDRSASGIRQKTDPSKSERCIVLRRFVRRYSREEPFKDSPFRERAQQIGLKRIVVCSQLHLWQCPFNHFKMFVSFLCFSCGYTQLEEVEDEVRHLGLVVEMVWRGHKAEVAQFGR